MKENGVLACSLLLLAVFLLFPAFTDFKLAGLESSNAGASAISSEEAAEPVENTGKKNPAASKNLIAASTVDNHSFEVKHSDYIPGYSPRAVTVGQFHPDGSARIMLGSTQGARGVVYRQIGEPYNFSLESQFFLSNDAMDSFEPLLSHDFDGDGLEEAFGHVESASYPGQSAIFIGWNGSGYSPKWNAIAAQIKADSAAQLYDIGNDGQLELITNTPSTTYIYSWDDGFENFREDAVLTGGALFDVGIGDIDNDGIDEILTSEDGGPGVRMYTREGDNYVEEYFGNYRDRYSAFSAVDIDNDSYLEIFAGTPHDSGSSYPITVYRWNGTGFTAIAVMDREMGQFEIKSGDIDGDGIAEALISNYGGMLSIVEVNSTGEYNLTNYNLDIDNFFRLYDFDGDGDLEIVQACSSVLSIYGIIYDDDRAGSWLSFVDSPAVVSTGDTWVTINWATNSESHGYVQIGYNPVSLRAGYINKEANDGFYSTNHELTITNLLKGTVYYFYVYSYNETLGVTVSSIIQSFTTSGPLIDYTGFNSQLIGWNGRGYEILQLSLSFNVQKVYDCHFELEITWNGRHWSYSFDKNLYFASTITTYFNFPTKQFLADNFSEGSFHINRLTVRRRAVGSIALDIWDIGYTSYYYSTNFGQPPLEFLGNYREHIDRSTGMPILVIESQVYVFEAGNHNITVKLATEDGDQISEFQKSGVFIDFGPQWVKFYFNGQDIFKFNSVCKFKLAWAQAVSESTGKTREVWLNYYTNVYNYMEFNPGIRYTGSHKNELTDWNGEYYEHLAISLEFRVSIPDNYSFILRIEHDDFYIQQRHQEKYSTGYYWVEFRFNASIILSNLYFQNGAFHLSQVAIRREAGGLWPFLFAINDLGNTGNYQESDFRSRIQLKGVVGSQIRDDTGEPHLAIDFELEVYFDDFYSAELQISDDQGHTWISETSSYCTSSNYYIFTFTFYGHIIVGGGFEKGEFNFDWLHVYDQDKGMQVLNKENFGNTESYTKADFGGVSPSEFNTPGFEMLIVPLVLPLVVFMKKKKK
ncbi:MAG: FG-GAP-like repeat-containing protein [Candidatus Odinarchaeota archaeon]